MKKRIRKILSYILTVALVFCMTPATAWANDGPEEPAGFENTDTSSPSVSGNDLGNGSDRNTEPGNDNSARAMGFGLRSVPMLGSAPEEGAAMVGETVYDTFQEALDAWADGTTLTLLSDVVTTATISAPSGTLDLNGHTIDVDNGAFSVITVGEDITLTMTGNGTVTGGRGNSANGGGVHVTYRGTFNMMNGTISGNDTGTNGNGGGGVFIAGGTFNMSDGSIINNSSRSGGGVYICDGGTFNMSSGSISNNRALLNPGGGVNVTPGTTFKVSGNVRITGNKDSSENANDVYGYINNSLRQLVTIAGPLADTASIGIKAPATNYPNTFTSGWTQAMGDPADYFFSDDASYIVVRNGGEAAIGIPPVAKLTSPVNIGGTYYTTVTDAISSWNGTDNSVLTLLKDIEVSSKIIVTGTRTLDLNGYGIRLTGSGSVFSVNGNMTINDSRPTETTHYFSVSDPASNGAGLATGISSTDSGDQKSFTGGYITGGTGEGVKVGSSGKLTLNGGTIIGNGTGFIGGGISVDNGTDEDALVMNGGAIKGNTSQLWGSAVWAGRSSGAELIIGGTAVITGNTSTEGAGTINVADTKNY